MELQWYMALEQEATETVYIFFTISLYSHLMTFSDLDAEGYPDLDRYWYLVSK